MRRPVATKLRQLALCRPRGRPHGGDSGAMRVADGRGTSAPPPGAAPLAVTSAVGQVSRRSSQP